MHLFLDKAPIFHTEWSSGNLILPRRAGQIQVSLKYGVFTEKGRYTLGIDHRSPTIPLDSWNILSAALF